MAVPSLGWRLFKLSFFRPFDFVKWIPMYLISLLCKVCIALTAWFLKSYFISFRHNALTVVVIRCSGSSQKCCFVNDIYQRSTTNAQWTLKQVGKGIIVWRQQNSGSKIDASAKGNSWHVYILAVQTSRGQKRGGPLILTWWHVIHGIISHP